MFSAIDALKIFLPLDPSLVDIGAAKGDFTSSFLEAFPGAQAVLFEPTGKSVVALQERFRENTRIQILSHAIGNAQGTATLYSYEQSENNSLLNSLVQDAEVLQNSVKVETLDDCLAQSGMLSKVDMIKIDTQGTDLKVIQGARKTIERFHPLILAEAIFVPLYDGQDSYYGILDFMRQLEYHLAGIFEMHCRQDGLLAFADLLFLPEQIYLQFCSSQTFGHFVSVDAKYLKEQNRTLEQVCEERLNLIEQLQMTADERLKLINELSKIAGERLTVIQTMDAEVKKLKGTE
ncbi:MAG: FkbM family methyltransferase [Bacteroidota bacterium]